MTVPDTSPEFFDAMFQDSTDPWSFAANTYEQSRYNTILKALGPGPYANAFEPGCSVGALTEKLAGICARVDACDFAPRAVEQARQRCKAFPGVTVSCASLTDSFPYATYDLILLSEIGYYFSSAAWKCLVTGIAETMQPGSILLASHWLGTSRDHVQSGDEVHTLIQHPHLQHAHGSRYPDTEHGGFRLDLWRKLP